MTSARRTRQKALISSNTKTTNRGISAIALDNRYHLRCEPLSINQRIRIRARSTLSAGFAFQTRSEAISLPLLIVIALVHVGVVVTVATDAVRARFRRRRYSRPAGRDDIARASDAHHARSRLRRPHAAATGQARKGATREAADHLKAPAPTPRTSEVTAAPAAADSPPETPRKAPRRSRRPPLQRRLVGPSKPTRKRVSTPTT